ncbi:MAG: hypothetical protein MJ237_02775 [bacterium]|nr:hypothetical protein [bacterium]
MRILPIFTKTKSFTNKLPKLHLHQRKFRSCDNIKINVGTNDLEKEVMEELHIHY